MSAALHGKHCLALRKAHNPCGLGAGLILGYRILYVIRTRKMFLFAKKLQKITAVHKVSEAVIQFHNDMLSCFWQDLK